MVLGVAREPDHGRGRERAEHRECGEAAHGPPPRERAGRATAGGRRRLGARAGPARKRYGERRGRGVHPVVRELTRHRDAERDRPPRTAAAQELHGREPEDGQDRRGDRDVQMVHLEVRHCAVGVRIARRDPRRGCGELARPRAGTARTPRSSAAARTRLVAVTGSNATASGKTKYILQIGREVRRAAVALDAPPRHAAVLEQRVAHVLDLRGITREVARRHQVVREPRSGVSHGRDRERSDRGGVPGAAGFHAADFHRSGEAPRMAGCASPSRPTSGGGARGRDRATPATECAPFRGSGSGCASPGLSSERNAAIAARSRGVVGRLVRRDRFLERGRRAVVEIGRGAPDAEQRRRVEAVERRAEPLAAARVDRADVVAHVERAVGERVPGGTIRTRARRMRAGPARAGAEKAPPARYGLAGALVSEPT